MKKIIIFLTFFFAGLVGIFLVFNFPFWSPIDEKAHFHYVEHLAQQKRLPILFQDKLTWQDIALETGTYPGQPQTEPRYLGFSGESYEAFQPPLYYFTALPFFYFGGENYINKIYSLRLWNLLLFLATIVIAAKTLTKLNLPPALLPIVALMPSFLIRSITISNTALEILLSSLIFYLTIFWLEQKKIDWLKISAISILLGLAVLTKLTSAFLIPAFIGYCLYLWRKICWQYLLIVFIPLVMLAPWFNFNRLHYGALTPNQAAMAMQAPIIWSNGQTNGLKGLSQVYKIYNQTYFVPEEMQSLLDGGRLLLWAKNLLVLIASITTLFALVVIAKYFIAFVRKNRLEKDGQPILAASLFLVANLTIYAYINYSWTPAPGRYLFPTLLPLVVIIYYLIKRYTYKPDILCSIVYAITLIFIITFDIKIVVQLAG